MHRSTRSRRFPTSPDHVVVALRDGGTAALRPLGPAEELPLLDVFSQMSSRSRASRYLAGVPALTPPMVRALVAVDGRDHVAWLASVEGRPAGVARYVRVGPASAEVALEVVDAHHRRGLGTALLDTVTTLACVNGIRRIEALVHADNDASVRLLTRLGLPLRSWGATLEGEGPLRLLDPPYVDRAAVVALAAHRLAAQTSAQTAWTTGVVSAH